ncbi:hypothetical protein H4R34_001287 [Dimargaris verticillata]|uniref:NTF2-related export protein n=1 Tax=Dimargaris verticillata TaxID=2761393 RepID=A0A9W8EEL8_9FUNG|nr:hypothetical protein H4R34_001287 [Dimargaris verticillata]
MPEANGTTSQAEHCYEEGKRFVELYYQLMDTHKPSLAQFYSDTSQIVWRNHPHQGGAQFLTAVIGKLPSTNHQIRSFDCQPVTAWNVLPPPGTPYNIALQVTGAVTYDNHTIALGFTHSFVLSPRLDHPGKYYISNEMFRLV